MSFNHQGKTVTMPDFTIIEAKPYHCGQMVRLLRHEHQQVIARIGANSHRELRAHFDNSSFRRTWLIDGKLGALGGVTGGKLSSGGLVWLAVAHNAMKYPLAMVREARRQLDEIMTVKRDLVTTILEGDEASKRFAIFLGFVPLGSEWVNRAESRFGRRDVAHKFDSMSESRIKIGSGYGVAMTYQPEQGI
jgi:hypothetical protein